MYRTFAISIIAIAAIAAAVAGCASNGDDSSKSTFNMMRKDEGQRHQTGPFKGVKANTGYAIHWTENGKGMLKVSDDFVIPDTPAPSWQVVDSRGNVYLLNQMKIKSGTNRQIVLPGYIDDVATVQCWCSFAEVLLGEASFERPVRN